MRIAYGILILFDLAIRASAFSDHYTELGVMPLERVFSAGLLPTEISLHVLNGSWLYQASLFLAHALGATLLLLGWRTRAMTVFCYVMALSLQHRNFAILDGGDTWMRLILFWAIYLPWGERYSLDSLRAAGPRENSVSSVPAYGYLIQVIIVYFVSALYKTGPGWRGEGSAIYYALQQTEWNSDRAHFFLFFPTFLTILSFATVAFELVGPWLLVSPILFGPLRTFAVLGFFSFHLGIEITMELGVFPYVGMATVLGLLPDWFWRQHPGVELDRCLRAILSPRRWSESLLRATPGVPAPPSKSVELALVLAIVFILSWNVAGQRGERIAIPSPLKIPGQILGLDQYWGLFAPEPGRVGGWLVIEGIFADGSTLDLRTGKAVDWSEPRSASIYKTVRWKRWYVVITNDDYAAFRPTYARYLFEKRGAEFPAEEESLKRIRLHWLSRLTLPGFEDSEPTSRVVMDYTREQVGL